MVQTFADKDTNNEKGSRYDGASRHRPDGSRLGYRRISQARRNDSLPDGFPRWR